MRVLVRTGICVGVCWDCSLMLLNAYKMIVSGRKGLSPGNSKLKHFIAFKNSVLTNIFLSNDPSTDRTACNYSERL